MKTKISVAAAMTRLLITDLYVLGGKIAHNNEPGMNDAKNNAQCPCGNSFETRNGGKKKTTKRRISDQVRSGAFDGGASVPVIG